MTWLRDQAPLICAWLCGACVVVVIALLMAHMPTAAISICVMAVIVILIARMLIRSRLAGAEFIGEIDEGDL